MSLGDHLREFRRRLFIASAALIVCSVVGWYLFDIIYEHLTAPIANIAKQRGEGSLIDLNYAGLTAAFSQRLSLAIWAGTILSAPMWLWQAWAFIVPGLTRKEKRLSLMFVAAIVPLFLGGCWFGYTTLPKAVEILLGFTPEGAANLPEASLYFAFVTRFILVFGFAFLFPVVLVALNVVGVLPAHIMIKGWRPAVVLIVVFAAIATPTPDPYTMLLLATPLIVLYFVAYGIARLIDRRRAQDRPDWLDASDEEASTL
ncbi:twin-arginine translocase subunit TatC [Knoellia locipacati]|uniref:Sec-independent protein translocase protein TatC n=1 Tax=Knoellia locipacati TaxID=882824 RepID=A0A512T2U6_9MICO|nr:twin-arginine translocase subunit TatC [Knoellia locipacati]GEQ14536.1 Sec-independent protein translocase protein TatC [Knoellia locipacati]